MYKPHYPKKVTDWISANADKIDEAWIEEDGYGGPGQGPHSIWIALRGHCVDECGGDHDERLCRHTLHEATGENLLRAAAMVAPCDCNRCKEG